MIKDICIFLTGTIAPSRYIEKLERRSTFIREEDYCNSIEKWMSLGVPIIFCENSNFDSKKISTLFCNYSGICEYLKYQSDIHISEKGRGEAEIFSYCYSHSKIIRNYKFIVKCTGRLFVGNLEKVISAISKQAYCFVYADLLRNLTWANSMCFIYDNKFYNLYLSIYLKKIDEKDFYYFEHALANSIHAAMADRYTFSLFPYPIRYIGYHGSSNLKIENSFLRIVKRGILLKLRKWAFKQAR